MELNAATRLRAGSPENNLKKVIPKDVRALVSSNCLPGPTYDSRRPDPKRRVVACTYLEYKPKGEGSLAKVMAGLKELGWRPVSYKGHDAFGFPTPSGTTRTCAVAVGPEAVVLMV